MTEPSAEEFQYGNPNPGTCDMAKLKADARTNLAMLYFKVLAYANESVHQGNDGIRCGFAKFDEDAHNIRAAWKWAALHLSGAAWAAEFCRFCTLAATYIAPSRLPPREWITWLEATVIACRQFGDRRGEG